VPLLDRESADKSGENHAIDDGIHKQRECQERAMQGEGRSGRGGARSAWTSSSAFDGAGMPRNPD
jgi:hypothetical protein